MPHQQDPYYSEDIPLENIQHPSKPDPMSERPESNGTGSTEPEDEDRLLDQEIQQFQNTQKSKFRVFLEAVWHGPQEPKDEPPGRIKSLSFLETHIERFQRAPVKYRAGWLSIYLIFWFLCVYNILHPYFTTPPGMDNVQVLNLGCTDQLWKGKNAACGMNGEECVPGEDIDKDVFVRCPALCDRSWTYSLEPIGDQRIKYRGYFIGGGDKMENPAKDQLSNPYRADSYVCGSAVHAGIVSPFSGGCARVSYSSGPQYGFEAEKGHYGVDDSIDFPSFFPASFFFKNLKSGFDKNSRFHQCYDPRLPVLVMNIILGFPIVLLGSGQVIFWTINTVGFWTIALATDPPVKVDSNNLESYASLLSTGLERFLPTCFILYALWSFSTKYTLDFSSGDIDKVSYLSRVFYFYPLFWLGVLNNISFDRLPVDRFTINDLKEQPGGAIAVTGIVLLVATCAVIQAYKIWEAGKFKKYLMIYSSFILGLLLISSLPGLTLRIHHYILAMLLIPGCCTRGITALMFQGILLGLFLSGAARWGLAAIAETDTSLRRNDPSGKILPPELLAFDITSGILSWADPLHDEQSAYNGVSILINDIERYVGVNISSLNLKQLFENSTELKTSITETLNSKFVSGDKTIPLYIRIGKKIMGTNRYSDFSNAAVLTWPSGDMDLPRPGIT